MSRRFCHVLARVAVSAAMSIELFLDRFDRGRLRGSKLGRSGKLGFKWGEGCLDNLDNLVAGIFEVFFEKALLYQDLVNVGLEGEVRRAHRLRSFFAEANLLLVGNPQHGAAIAMARQKPHTQGRWRGGEERWHRKRRV